VTRSDLTHTAATAALELLPDGVLVVCDGKVVLANRALARLTGEDLTGRPAPDWLPAGGSGEVVVRGRPRIVTVAPCDIGSVVTVRDSAAPSVLAHRASHDGLTGLLNQRAFRERLAAESERCALDGRPLSVIVVDLDTSRRSTTSTAIRPATACWQRPPRASPAPRGRSTPSGASAARSSPGCCPTTPPRAR